MTESKLPSAPRSIHHRLLLVILATALLLAPSSILAQAGARYVRLHLRDKGTPFRYLTPSDPQYQTASAHLSPRALLRRAKVLPAARLVSTDDLPVHPPYLAEIRAEGAEIVQSSRWLNTVMVRADSMTIERLRRLPILARIEILRSDGATAPAPRAKLAAPVMPTRAPTAADGSDCLTEHYGLADFQNRFMGIDEAHRIGIAGEGVLVGVLDAGFERRHRAFAETGIEAEYDFIYGNANTADEAEDSLAPTPQEEHGTMVLSLIGATWRDTLVGGAPRASFMLAKTEDLRHERHVEEDNFVAGLEWLEAQGVDITNTSLGYTTFDAPERPHDYAELDGHTVPASRAVNHATMLGVVSVVAAGNEGRGAFVYVGVPGEADSAIAAAAVDSNGLVAGFSSRGIPDHEPSKPDVAAFGVGNWAAHPSSSTGLRKSQGTSFAAPMTTAVATLLLSAAPELRPWELRRLIESTADRSSTDADTAIGSGRVNVGRALRELARRRAVVGVPAISFDAERQTIAVAAGVLDERPRGSERQYLDSHLIARIRWRDTLTGPMLEARVPQPISGIARWSFAPSEGPVTGPLLVEILDAASGAVLRRYVHQLNGDGATPSTTLCSAPALAVLENDGVSAYPNPFGTFTRVAFDLDRDAAVSLTIFNSRGEQVARLLDEAASPAGEHSVLFDARGLPSGTYYARLRVGDETRTGEMIYTP